MKRIAVVTGGNSSEIVISVKSADTIIANLDKTRYLATRVEIRGLNWIAVEGNDEFYIDKNDFSYTKDSKVVFDAALIMIHGDPGEDGKLQGYFDMLNIPYTSSNVITSATTFNKHFTKQYLKSYNIPSAKWLMLNKHIGYNLNSVDSEIGFPCFVKPNNAGSSFGVSKVSNFEQLEDAVDKAMSEDTEVMVEAMVEGTEITCGVLRTSKNAYVLPITEIVSTTGFFDYEAKYTEGMAEEIIPARIPDSIAKQCQELTLRIYDLFGCKWFSRVDYILDRDQHLCLLEINTIPGMSAESIVPKMLRAANLNLKDLMSEILSDILP